MTGGRREPGLADARLADEEHQITVAGTGPIEGTGQDVELVPAAHEATHVNDGERPPSP